MSEDLTFYTHPMSRGRIVRWMLEETGVPYRTELLDYATTLKSADYLAINPMGKIPALTHRGVVITETAAICAYLADAFPEKGLAPPVGAPERGAYYRWLFFAAGPVESAVMNAAAGFQAKPEQSRMLGYGSMETLTAALAAKLEDGGYLAGGAFSAADVYLGSQLGWGLQFKALTPHPAFDRYLALVRDREAYRRAVKIDEDLMAVAAAR